VDLDRDGDVDLLRASDLGLGWSENLDGLGASWQNRILFAGSKSELCTFGDVDADGDLDVLAHRRVSGSPTLEVKLCWYENQTPTRLMEATSTRRAACAS
jgi:hypothetical protein